MAWSKSCVFFLLCCLSSLLLEGATSPLPGRLGSDEVYYTELGNMKVFFYMTPEKDKIARQLLRDINEKMALTIDVTSPPCPVSEVSAMATKFPDPISYDKEGHPIYADPVGQDILNKYAENVKAIAEKRFDITLEGLSREMSLNLNHDALKVHQDHFTKQYDYLSHKSLPVSRYNLFQDLTLADWQMAPGSFSATMVQDGFQGDRFLMVLFPGEVVGKVYTEPMVYEGPNVAPKYPGPITFCPHSAVAPIPLESHQTVGSWKGSRISTSTRGVVKEEEIQNLCTKATYLPVNRPTVENAKGKVTYRYSNGISLRKASASDLPGLSKKSMVTRLPDQENITIYQKDIADCKKIYSPLLKDLGLNGSLNKVLELTKRDGGFSRLERVNLDIADDDQLVIINRSFLPEGYKPFTLSEDCTAQGMPWIQMYHFPKDMVMTLSGANFKKLAFTPIEEILYREHKIDANDGAKPQLRSKIISKIEVLVLKTDKKSV